MYSLNIRAGLSGEGQYYLGNGGYGEITDAGFTDLDYTRDFSIEAAVEIGVAENDTTWMGIVTKTHRYGMYNSNFGGWGISITQSDQMYTNVYAKVGDGDTNVGNQVQLLSSSHVGRLHIVATWNVGSKTLTLFINGQQFAQASNAALDPAGIDVTDNLWMGKSLNLLSSPILYVRLWNRDLSSDITTLFNHFDSTSQHRLPIGFNTTDLHSEWLMHEESDASGATGNTHIRDTAGPNHVNMTGGADLISSAGLLTNMAPASGASNQNKAITLLAGGGYDTLAALGTVVGPVQYYFQIDETPTFNSPDLQESGWVADFSRQQFILKPDTTYFWRVKVRDSNSTPLTSGYTPAQSFTTEGSTVWYVRPASGTLGNPGGTIYGTQNGTSYADAWNGLHNVVWGETGVEAGDTLYIAGLHVFGMPGSVSVASIGDILVTTSGLSHTYPVTIRGDYAGDNGVVWGGYTPNYAVWTQGTGSVYSTTLTGNHYLRWFFQDVTQTSYVALQSQTNLTDVASNPGSFYLEPDSSTLHVHTTDSADPTGRITVNRFGYDFHLGEQQYIHIKNFEWNVPLWLCDQAKGSSAGCSNIQWENLDMTYGEGMMFRVRKFMHGWRIIDCNISLAGNGIYNNDSSNDAPRDYIYRGNTIKDIGIWGSPGKQDAHCIGIQGGDNGMIENNYCSNTGSAIVLYAFTGGADPNSNQTLTNTIIRNNFIDGTHTLSNPGHGISMASDNNHLWDKTGIEIYGNIVRNATPCYRSQYEDQVKFYNNIGYNCDYGIHSSRNFGNNVGGDVWWRNNIVLDPTSYHIFWNSGATSGFNIDFDYNLYHPAAPLQDIFYKSFEGNAITFAEWQSLNNPANQTLPMPGMVFDPNSIADQDPLFANSNGDYSATSDFNLQWNSPAIDAGVDVGLITDRAGNPVYGSPDIGAFEYQPPYIIGIHTVDAGADIRIYGDGKFRNTAAPGGVVSDITASPTGGFISGNYSRFLDLSIGTWELSGLYGKQFSGETPIAMTVNYTVGDLKPNTGYVLQIDGVDMDALQSGGSGKISFSQNQSASNSTSFVTVDAAVGTDTDGDGLSDIYEKCFDGDCTSSNPYPGGGDLDYNDPDTDGDGYTDGEEIKYGSDPADNISTPNITPDGDVNIDGVVNVADILLAQRYVLGLMSFTQSQIDHGDMAPLGAGDNAITLGDLLLITKTALASP